MDSIVGGREVLVPGDARADALSESERAVAEALLTCIGRWGLAKTTLEDVAREAGVSRATVYRLFPGGKQAILDAAAQAEVSSLLALLTEVLADVDDLERYLVGAVHLAADVLRQHEALTFLREHEPVALEKVLAFDRLDRLFLTAGELLRPGLERFLDADGALATGIWLTRLVVSYLMNPGTELDLAVRADVERLVRDFVLPGIAAQRSVDLRDRPSGGAAPAAPTGRTPDTTPPATSAPSADH